jgi:hypothetical protein
MIRQPFQPITFFQKMIKLEEDEIEEYIPTINPDVFFSEETPIIPQEDLNVADWRMKIRVK